MAYRTLQNFKGRVEICSEPYDKQEHSNKRMRSAGFVEDLDQ